MMTLNLQGRSHYKRQNTAFTETVLALKISRTSTGQACLQGCANRSIQTERSIAVDNLISMQFFDYKRRVKKNNVIVEQIIKCKIKGLRSDGLKEYLERKKT